jgi:hypothetical protein
MLPRKHISHKSEPADIFVAACTGEVEVGAKLFAVRIAVYYLAFQATVAPSKTFNLIGQWWFSPRPITRKTV